MMKIANIEPYIIVHKLDTPFYFSQWQYDTRKICIVKITLDDGTYGWGEGYGPANVIKAGIEFFTPFLLGKDALEIKNSLAGNVSSFPRLCPQRNLTGSHKCN